MTARTIELPEGTRCRLAMRPPHHLVVVAPSPLEPTLEALFARPKVVGIFTHDSGVNWPDRDGCRWAVEYLRTGHAIALQFENLADALACHKAPSRERGRVVSRAKAGAGRKRPIIVPKPDTRDLRAASLDRVADLELTMGHVVIAERLARMAAELRECAP